MKIPIKKLNEAAKVPTRGSVNCAGFDLYAAQTVEVGKHTKVPTGIAVAIPRGHYGRIAPRSGLAANFGIDVLGGVIDSDYRGEISVILSHPHPYGHIISEGDRIAQIIIERCFDADFIEFDSLDETERGQGGFGSTGVSEPILEGAK